MVDLRPLLTANINGIDARLVLDSGAFFNMISTASAAELKLKRTPAPIGLYVTGINGATDVAMVKVKTLILAGVPIHDVEFLVGGGETGRGSIGLLGQNLLRIGDVEYDLGQGVVRLMKAENCQKAVLAYWAGTSTPYSVIDLTPERAQSGHLSYTISTAYVNGTKIRVMFDTGAATSVLSLSAAARAGIRPDSPGVISAGVAYGVGKSTLATYLAPFASFKIGDEEIKNTRLRIGDIDLQNADMLIGADFFLSHRIYVANSQYKLYFTYNGGPVFNLAAGSRPVAQTETDASARQPNNEEAVADAADYSRRGAVFASRREFDQAIAALTRACELAPDHAEYFSQRGTVYWQLKQPAPAMADFDQALKLKPDNLPTLVARAGLLLERGDKDLAAADVEAADAVAPKEADERYQMAYVDLGAERLAPAIAQFSLWIDSHAADARLPDALNARCWSRAIGGEDLALALKDCNAALRRAEKSSTFFANVANSRGLVYLRMGDYDRSIADYDAALKISARNAGSLYGRGIAKLRKQKTSEGEADIALATSLRPQVVTEFKQHGIVP